LTSSDAAIPAIELRNVSKRYWKLEEQAMLLRSLLPFARPTRSPIYALRDIDLTMSRGETLGIIGRNGSGKSTALKLMAGVTAPTSGEVYVVGRVSPLIELGAGFHPDLTGRENVHLNGSILGMSGRETDEQFASIVEFAELAEFIDTPVKRYSSGMYGRLGFAVAVHSNPDLLLVDEVLSVGDTFFQEKCLAKMHEFKDKGITIVLVSHSPALVTSFCERAIWIDHGHLMAEGRADDVVAEYLERVPHLAQATT
jgi:ABC-type polysaccharide/polyol phosphate transport system ATPase subunit